ncbi:AAA family ATPase [Alteromonas sp. ASW11-19]|uniref:AAA family ATPase n=1 Tax=Alteromonas salexigens TaxID=2982530 RepID=A0ABT2VRX3_9ALTE|nr:AAA family ATPase [Alteromonas salexigens]MCU7555885.1 AAA family ATPase [Alteromonas salexigens]
MSIIRHIAIRNFRGIQSLDWYPIEGINCVIGPGDSGKSSVLDAIDLCLGARRNISFTDADFHNSNVDNPIEIYVTLGRLSDELLSIERYGSFLRSYNLTTQELYDEPQVGAETVITVRLVVDKGLDPDWGLYSDRAAQEGLEKRLPWSHRELISPTRLGEGSSRHFTWGRNSLLNKLLDDRFDVSEVLTEVSRNARQAFAQQNVDGIHSALASVQGVADTLGVNVGELKALLDVSSVSVSHGAVSLHDANSTPIRQMGTGSTRLLLAGLQKLVSNSKLLIIDEVEFGLEPFRISRLLKEIGAKEQQPTQQVFITTHSPYVLRELKSSQLHILRKYSITGQPQINHVIYSMNDSDEHQSTLRVCAEAFLSNKVIVCEGKTEIGLLKGVDAVEQVQGQHSIQSLGVMHADGGGSHMFKRAKVFNELGYPVAIFKDSDINDQQQASITEAIRLSIPMFEWGENQATEQAIFNNCHLHLIPQLLNIAIERKTNDAVNTHIINATESQFNLISCIQTPQDAYRPYLGITAKKKEWYKDIEPMENVAETVLWPNKLFIEPAFTQVLDDLLAWARQ